MDRMTGGSGRGLIKIDLNLQVKLQIATNISTPLELNSVLLFLNYVLVSCLTVRFSWYLYYAQLNHGSFFKTKCVRMLCEFEIFGYKGINKVLFYNKNEIIPISKN